MPEQLTEAARKMAITQAVIYLTACLVPFMLTAILITFLEIFRPGGDWNSNTTTALLAGASIVAGQAVLLVKGIFNGQVSEVNRKYLEHQHDCLHEVGKEVVKAKEAAVQSVNVTRQGTDSIIAVVEKSGSGTSIAPPVQKIDVNIHSDQ